MNRDAVGAATKKTAAAAFKSGKKLAVGIAGKTAYVAGKTQDCLERRYGNLPELCESTGADFTRLESMPPRIMQRIDVCSEIADGLDLPALRASLGEIFEQVSSPLYTVLVIGRYNTGKSSLINALLGRDILPSGAIPTTKVLTWLLAGDEDSVICEKENGELLTAHLSALSDSSSENQINQSRNIMVTVDNELLKSGVALIDTPGLQDTDQSSVETALAAIENADALLYVVDTYMSDADNKFLSKLSEAGKTDNLFVIINKMDLVPDDERHKFIQEKIDVLIKLGIAANIFPISARDRRGEMREMLGRLKTALTDFMVKDMEKSRNSIVEGKVNALMDVAHGACQRAESALELQAGKQPEAQMELQKYLKAITDRRGEALQQAKRKVKDVENRIMFNWQNFYSDLQEKVDVEIIDNATVDDLKRRGVIEREVLNRTYNFLEQEFEDAAAALDSWVDSKCDECDECDLTSFLPWIRDSFELGKATSTGISKIPPQLVTAGLVIFNYTTYGLFSAIKTFVVTTLGAPLFDSFISSMTGLGEVAAMRRQLRKVLDEHWPQLDERIMAIIKVYCDSLKHQAEEKIKKSYAMSMEKVCAPLKVLERSSQPDPEKLKLWLKSTERK